MPHHYDKNGGIEIKIILDKGKEMFPEHAGRIDSLLGQIGQEASAPIEDFVESVEGPIGTGTRDELVTSSVQMVRENFSQEEIQMMIDMLLNPIQEVSEGLQESLSDSDLLPIS